MKGETDRQRHDCCHYRWRVNTINQQGNEIINKIRRYKMFPGEKQRPRRRGGGGRGERRKEGGVRKHNTISANTGSETKMML